MIEDVPVHERKNIILQSKPDNTDETYSRTPVSKFAQGMLQKMGYQEGKPIGRNPATALLKPIEFLSRGDREGLGVNPMKTFKYIDEKKEKETKKFKEVIILTGKYKKMEGVITEVYEKKGEQNHYQIEIKKNGDSIKLQEDQIVEKQFYKGSSSKSRSRSRSQKKLRWITSGITVKVKHKNYMNGQLYNKKITIQDVMDEYSFCALGPKHEIIEDLREKDVKPVLPKKGGNVYILQGSQKGEMGKFIEKKDKKTVVIKLNDQLIELPKKHVSAVSG